MNQWYKLLILLSCMSYFFVGFTQAATIHVDASGEGDVLTLQQAINQAQSGDTILVHPGIYHEQVHITTSITLVGVDMETTIINASRLGSVITLETDNVTIKNLTLTGGELRFPQAAIYVNTTGNTVTNMEMTDNYYGMVFMDPASDNHVFNNHIHHNHQCGIYFSGATHNILENNTVHHQPFNGFGLYDFSNNNLMKNNYFSYNDLNGINIRDSYENLVDGNTFENNTYGLHVPPPQFHNGIGENEFINNPLDEQSSSFMIGLPASILLIFFGVLILKLRKQ